MAHISWPIRFVYLFWSLNIFLFISFWVGFSRMFLVCVFTWLVEKYQLECSPMARETSVQSQVESYQRLKKWYLLPPCLTLSIIRYGSRVKWSNPGKGVAHSPTPWCSSYRKGAFGLPSTKVANFTLLTILRLKNIYSISYTQLFLMQIIYCSIASSILLYKQ